MIRGDWWFVAVVPVFILWQECGENLAVFCYRIGVDLFARFGEFFTPRIAQRVPVACSNPSFTSFARFTTRKGSNS